jgi:hypothetical protein
MELRRARGERFPLAEAASLLSSLCVDAAARHAGGESFVLQPSAVVLDGARARIQLQAPPATLPRDKACLAPEQKSGAAGGPRASIFAVGAMLYEMVTGESVGPGMRRPTEIVPGLSPSVEVILGKALVADPAHRPDDLAALAQALEGLVAGASDAGDNLEGDDEFEVDVRLSMLPPAAPQPSAPQPRGSTPSADGFGVAVQARALPRNDPTSRLADLKARLESDPRPRYIVIQEGMDHGPFSAVELLQQIATNAFSEDSFLRDTLGKEERPLKDWDEFAPFAEQAKLHREIKAEKVELEKNIESERKSTNSKAIIGVVSLAAITALVGGIVLKARGTRDDTVSIQGDSAVNVETNGGLKAGAATAKAGAPGPGGRLATAGGFPVLPGGLSCEGAQAKYSEEMKIGEKGAPDLTQGQFSAVLGKGSYLNSCGVPSATEVSICAAVQNGRAVGVTVSMNPPNPGQASCVAGQVRALSFPSNPKLDVARTTFK